tara:strand:+ start:368 stop:583 length:216 start_codon:yes stop_codon:yes gene_type:complete
MKYVMLAAAAVFMLMALGCDDEKSSDTGADSAVVETTDTSAETTPSDTADSESGEDTGGVEDTSSDTAVSD